MEQNDKRLCEELKEKAQAVADRFEEVADDLETAETEKEDFGSALEDCKSAAEGMTAENWQEKANEIIERVKGVL